MLARCIGPKITVGKESTVLITQIQSWLWRKRKSTLLNIRPPISHPSCKIIFVENQAIRKKFTELGYACTMHRTKNHSWERKYRADYAEFPAEDANKIPAEKINSDFDAFLQNKGELVGNETFGQPANRARKDDHQQIKHNFFLRIEQTENILRYLGVPARCIGPKITVGKESTVLITRMQSWLWRKRKSSLLNIRTRISHQSCKISL